MKSTNQPNTPEARRVGRPRADGQLRTGDVREQILDEAARLFIAKGYAGTSTREIAAAIGLRQGSLAHYFRLKEQILAELLNRTIDPAIELVDALDPALPAAVRLWTLLVEDCTNLCSGDHNLASLMNLPAARSETFSEFWAQREELRNRYRDIIDDGRQSGVFRMEGLDLATDATFAIVESLINWFDRNGSIAAKDAARYVARAALLGLLNEPESFEAQIVGT